MGAASAFLLSYHLYILVAGVVYSCPRFTACQKAQIHIYAINFFLYRFLPFISAVKKPINIKQECLLIRYAVRSEIVF